MSIKFKILSGLPAYGPIALSFPVDGKRAHVEGLVIQFQPDTTESWTGNFQRGDYGIDKVLPHPDGSRVIVISGGKGYLVDPITPNNTNSIPGHIKFAAMLPDLQAVLFGNDIAFEAWRADGSWWNSPRIAWDGMRNILVQGNELTGETYSPIDDKWHPFKLDLLTGTCLDSVYKTQMAGAIPIRKPPLPPS